MATNSQRIFGWLNKQHIENKNIVVDDKYLRSLLIFPNNPSVLNIVIFSLYESISESTESNKKSLPPDIQEKLDYNNVTVFRDIINSNYSENGHFLDAAYEALESETPGRKKIFLSWINTLYLTALGIKLKENTESSRLDVIQNYADDIITEVINGMLIRISQNGTQLEGIENEMIELAVITIVCHAFVDCKVLENPNNV